MAICEMCGRDASLSKSLIEGVHMQVCTDCGKYGKKVVAPAGKFFKPKESSQQPEYRVKFNYSNLLRNARENKNLSQADFAKLLNERESVIAKWESGGLKPRIEVARRVGRLLHVALIEMDEQKITKTAAKKVEEPTLGDFIKVRKRVK